MLTDAIDLTKPSAFSPIPMPRKDDPSVDQSGAEPVSPQDKLRLGDSKAQQADLFELEPPPWELESQEDADIATVVFSESPHGPYDYRVPDSFRGQLQAGMRVRVPLGKRRKSMIAWCTQVELGTMAKRPLRDILEIVDTEPLCDAPWCVWSCG